MSRSEIVDRLFSLEPEERIDLFSRLAHEINAPLTVISGFTGLILMNPAEVPENLKVILDKLLLGYKAVDENLLTVSLGTDMTADYYLETLGVAINAVLTPIPSEVILPTEKESRYLYLIKEAQRKLAQSFNSVFNIGNPETFFFDTYLGLYSNLNRATLQERGIKLFDHTLEFPLEVDTPDYALVLDNLIGNAIKHGFKGELTRNKKRIIKVTTRASYDPGLGRVSDNGAGFNLASIVEKASQAGILPKDHYKMSTGALSDFLRSKGLCVSGNIAQKARLGADYRNQLLMQLAFLPGVSTSDSDNGLDLVYNGAGTSQGLGLDTVKTLVERNGGDVWVQSHPGDTRIYFTIPQKRVISGLSR